MKDIGVMAVVVALAALVAAAGLYQMQWLSSYGARGRGKTRLVFSIGLVLAALLWIGYVIWSAR